MEAFVALTFRMNLAIWQNFVCFSPAELIHRKSQLEVNIDSNPNRMNCGKCSVYTQIEERNSRSIQIVDIYTLHRCNSGTDSSSDFLYNNYESVRTL